MWTYRRVVGVGPLPWAIWSGLAALLPYAAVLWWVHARLLEPGGWLRAVGFFAAFVVIRFMGAGWYSVTARRYGGWTLLTAGSQVMEVNPRHALGVGAGQWPVGILLGLAAWVSGLFGLPPGGWWWVVLVGVPVVQGLLLFGTAWLYTWLVVSMSRPFLLLGAPEEAGEERALREAVPGRTRTVVGTLVYAWIVCGALAVILTLLTGLFVLVHHVPAGYFGLGVALFVGFSVAVVGFPVAVMLGLWFQLLAALYKTAGRGMLRLRWREERMPVSVE
jgi:hypothetical protein